MATIQAAGDKIKIDKAFVSGKDRVTVNGQVAFEGKMTPGTPVEFTAGARTYIVETRIVSKMTKALSIQLRIIEGGQEIHADLYNQAGKAVSGEKQARAAGAVQACAMVGAVIGFATMMFLNAATGTVPGGAIGGAIGGGLGSMIGFGIGTLLFGKSNR